MPTPDQTAQQPERLNGQQIQALQNAWAKALAHTVAAMELRKFAVEYAAKFTDVQPAEALGSGKTNQRLSDRAGA